MKLQIGKTYKSNFDVDSTVIVLAQTVVANTVIPLGAFIAQDNIGRIHFYREDGTGFLASPKLLPKMKTITKWINVYEDDAIGAPSKLRRLYITEAHALQQQSMIHKRVKAIKIEWEVEDDS